MKSNAHDFGYIYNLYHALFFFLVCFDDEDINDIDPEFDETPPLIYRDSIIGVLHPLQDTLMHVQLEVADDAMEFDVDLADWNFAARVNSWSDGETQLGVTEYFYGTRTGPVLPHGWYTGMVLGRPHPSIGDTWRWEILDGDPTPDDADGFLLRLRPLRAGEQLPAPAVLKPFSYEDADGVVKTSPPAGTHWRPREPN